MKICHPVSTKHKKQVDVFNLSRVIHCWWRISGSPPWDGVKTLRIMGTTKQPQLVSQISKPSTIYLKTPPQKKTTHYQTNQKHEKSPFKTKENVKKVRFTCHKQEKRTGLSKLASTNRCFFSQGTLVNFPHPNVAVVLAVEFPRLQKKRKNINCWNVLWRIGAMRGWGRSFLMTGDPELNKPWHWPSSILRYQGDFCYLLTICFTFHCQKHDGIPVL